MDIIDTVASADVKRAPGARLRTVRSVMRIVGRVSPGMAARWAERLWFTVPRFAPSVQAENFLKSGSPLDLRWEAGRIAGWSWGAGPTVLLVHGWGANAAQLRALVAPLVVAKYKVVSFDAPGHGTSAAGRMGAGRSSGVEYAEALQAVSRSLGALHAVVGHSLGAHVVACSMLAGLKVERAVLIAPLADPFPYLRKFASAFAISGEVLELMQRNAQARLRFRWDALNVPQQLGRHGHLPPVLVVHDRGDPEISWADGAAVAGAWPRSQLLSTTGLGHRRIVRDREVIGRIAAFIAGGESAGPDGQLS